MQKNQLILSVHPVEIQISEFHDLKGNPHFYTNLPKNK